MTDKITAIKWNEELAAQLVSVVGDESPVSNSAVTAASTMLDITERRVAAKLRKMGYEVASMAKPKAAAFSDEEGADLATLVEDNPGALTYKDIAEQFAEGKFNHKQIQGKLLHLELTTLVKPSEKVVVASKYTEEEDAQFVEAVAAGSFIEDLAEQFGRKIPSIRGKALSLLTKGLISAIPPQKTSTAKTTSDVIADLGNAISEMTVAEISEATGKTDRGVKTILTRRGISAADYDGAKKHAKALAKLADVELAAG